MTASGTSIDFLDHAPVAFAYHEIILNETGAPVDFKFLRINAAFELLSGLKAQDIVGKKRSQLFPQVCEPEDKCIDQLGEIAMEGGNISFENFCPLFNKWIRIHVFSDEKGFFGTFAEDISEHKNDKEKLLIHSQKHETVLSSMVSPVFILDRDHSFVDCFCKSDELLYKPQQLFLGKKIHDILPEHVVNLYLKAAKNVKVSGIAETIEYNLELNGVEKWFNATINLHNDGQNMVVSVHDNTQLKHVEDTVKQIETYFDFFFKQSMEGLYFTFLETPQLWNDQSNKEVVLDYAEKHQIISSVNQAFADQYGYTINELLGKPVASIFEHNPETGRSGRRQLFDKGHLRLTTAEKKKDGSEMWIEGEYMCVYNEQGEITGTIGAQREITERINAVSELKESEEKFRNLSESTATGIGIYQNDHWIYTNAAFQKSSGYSEEELLKMNFWDFAAPEHWEKIKEIGLSRQEGKKTVSSYETKVFTKNKEERWVYIQGTTITINGKPAGLISAIDNTEQYKIMKALQESEARWKFALEGAGDGVWDWNIKTDKVYYSPQWKKMLGYEVDEISDNLYEWENRVHPDDIAPTTAEVEKYLKGLTPIYINKHRIKCKDGKYKWILDRGKIITYSKKGEPIRMIGTHTDISKLVEAEEQILKAKNEIEKNHEELEIYRKNLEKLVQDRTAELENKNEELERFNSLFVGREFRIKELRDTIDELKRKLSEYRDSNN
ncbi:MAG TPA: PAS domain S-box protein [Bacteroidales bacterium]|nr:PAS domain S-box protein [Bacteroidales bacterium]HPE56052.1 PAS domain S-box protein [Bacteroidales bacterium]